MRKLILRLLIAAVVVLALIYGGHLWWLAKYGASAQPIPSAILEVDKGFSFPPGFPPDPGDAGKKTVHGVDSDRDGLRDDLQRWIYAFVPKEPKKQAALRQMARYFQVTLSDSFESEARVKANIQDRRAIQCLDLAFGDSLGGYTESIYLKAKTLNTFSRVKRYWSNNALIEPDDVAEDWIRYEAPCDAQ